MLHYIQNSERDEAEAFDIASFCQRFRINRTAFYRELDAGRLVAKKVGRRTIITKGRRASLARKSAGAEAKSYTSAPQAPSAAAPWLSALKWPESLDPRRLKQRWLGKLLPAKRSPLRRRSSAPWPRATAVPRFLPLNRSPAAR